MLLYSLRIEVERNGDLEKNATKSIECRWKGERYRDPAWFLVLLLLSRTKSQAETGSEFFENVERIHEEERIRFCLKVLDTSVFSVMMH
jgi:hypothetical protein